MKAHPGTKVDFNFAASGVLLQQIGRGAAVDVFASADETTMDQAQQRDLLAAGTREVFAVNALWVVVPPQNKASPRTLKDLAGAGVQRIALGNPDSVPVGRYARARWKRQACGRQCRARPSPRRTYASRWITWRAVKWMPASSMPPTHRRCPTGCAVPSRCRWRGALPIRWR